MFRRKGCINDTVALDTIQRITFYKRDEITTDLTCCDIETINGVLFFHEEAPGWNALIALLNTLSGFDQNWFASVSQPPFEPSPVFVYERD